MKYDLLIKGGTVVDPSQGLAARRDVAMAQGKVAAVEPSIVAGEAAEVLDAEGLIVTPGLVDLHVHAYWGASTYGVDPDISNAAKGVTTALDAGSAGALTFGAFRTHTLTRADTRLFALLNISAMGMISPTIGELEDSRWADVELAVEAGLANREYVKGVKARLGRHLVGDSDDVEMLGGALEAAERIGGLRPRVVILPYWDARHPDHSHACQIGYEGCYLAGLAKLDLSATPDKPASAGRPHRPHKVIYSTMYDADFRIAPSFVVDITPYFKQRMRAVACYRSQFRGPQRQQGVHIPLTEIEQRMATSCGYFGQLIGVAYGEPFVLREALQMDDITALQGLPL